MGLTRRSLIRGGLAFASISTLPVACQPIPKSPDDPANVELTIEARERPYPLFGAGAPESRLWTFSDEFPPVIRLRQGARLKARLKNALPEHTSIHWHGLRIENRMDGVPFLTQPPVESGESFDYEFTPPDSGTFFFHPHCDTVNQLGRGLVGVLIVDGDETRPFDADLSLVLKDWRVDQHGAFLPMTTDKGAARGGTFGTLRTVNGTAQPSLSVPADGDVRLRLLNVDNTRVSEIGIEGAEAAIIAIDGVPVDPLPLKSWRLGPAMRVDLAMRAPLHGRSARLVDYFAPQPIPLARLQSHGESRQRTAFDPSPLRASHILAPDLTNATLHSFDFSSTAINRAAFSGSDDPAQFADALCLADRTFWAINRQSWPEDAHQRLPTPLAQLELGRSYVFELINRTPHMHPIHIHGHTFLVLSSNKRELPRHHADTVLLTPKERVQVAFVADNPGDWMFHCHIIEHQDTGMMGIIRVS